MATLLVPVASPDNTEHNERITNKLNYTDMTRIEFLKATPVLYGWITVDGVQRIGSFRPCFNRYTNSIAYAYHTSNGNKGKGGFTLHRGFALFEKGQLSTDPAKGNPENYVG